MTEGDADTCISQDDRLYRAFKPTEWDENKGRIGSGVLVSQEISCDWVRLRTLEDFMERLDRAKRGMGCISILVKDVRDVGCIVRYSPTGPDELGDPNNLAHVVIVPSEGARTSKMRALVTEKKYVLEQAHKPI